MKHELSVAIKYWDLYYSLSQQDLKSRFRRSRLGILWIVIQQLVFSLGAGLVWTNVFGVNANEFIPFLTIGITVWSFIASSMTEGCGTFVIAHSYLKQLPLPQSIFIFRTLLTQCFYLFVGIATTFIILVIFGKFKLISIVYTIPGLLILLIYFYAASGSMAYLGLRYRDIQHALTGIFSLLFILTPVIYPPEILIKKGIAFVVYGNPFASLIEIIRCPLLNNDFANTQHYLVALGFTNILLVIRFSLEKKWGRFVPFWS